MTQGDHKQTLRMKAATMAAMEQNRDPLLTLHCDGRVTVSDKLKPEETAKLVLDQIKAQWMDDVQATKIRELNDRIKRLEEAGDAMAMYADGHDAREWDKAKETKP